MALVAGGVGGSTVMQLNSALDRLKPALSLIKSALDERDGWEVLASEHERKSLDELKSATPKVRSAGGGRGSGGGGKMLRTNKRDLSAKPRDNFKVPSSVPRNIQNRLIWAVFKTDLTDIAFNAAAIVENNYSFQINNIAGTSNYTSTYDQYCLVQGSVTFSSTLPPGQVTGVGTLHSALDFDNVTNIGSIQALDNFSSSQTDMMSPGRTIVRSIRPCCKLNAAGTNSVVPMRCWIDCSATGIAHFGIRTVLDIAGAYNLHILQTVWIAFRNEI
jgi:hypothetical protein